MSTRLPARHPARIALVAPTLQGGGAERLATLIASRLDRSRFRPIVVLLYGSRADAYASQLPDDVEIEVLGRPERLVVPRLTVRMAARLRRLRPSAAIGFLTFPNLVALAGADLAGGLPVIVTEHADPRRLTGPGRRLGLRRIAAVLYRRAYRVVAVSEGIRQAWITKHGLAPERVVRIYNPIDPGASRRGSSPHAWFEDEIPVLVAAGRLAPQKGFDDLLRALAEVRTPSRLIILGEGTERKALEAEAHRLGIEERVLLPGFVEDPFAYMSHAAAFVLSSRWEGFPLVIGEAMRAGAPVIATDCDFGPSELITDEQNGLLVAVGDPSAMARAIERVLTEPGLGERLRSGGRARSEDLAVERVVAEYEALLSSAVEERRPPSVTYVFLGSSRFSGSTLLVYLLGGHPEIATVSEVAGTQRRGHMDSYLCSCGRLMTECPFWAEVAERMRERGHDDFTLENFGTRFRGEGLGNNLLTASLRSRLLEQTRDIVLDPLPARRAWLQHGARRSRDLGEIVAEIEGATVFIDASKEGMRGHYLARVFDDSLRAIHLVRDVRGVVASALRRNSPPGVTARRAAESWAMANATIERNLRNLPADRRRFVRYEDLATRPEETVRSLLEFLEVDPAVSLEQLLAGGAHDQHLLGNKMRLAPVTEIKLDERWRTELTAEHMREIESVVGRLED